MAKPVGRGLAHITKQPAPSTRIPSRITPELAARIDAWIDETPGPKPTKTAAINYLLDLGLKAVTAERVLDRLKAAGRRGAK
jgi:hypothetical protein